MQLLLDATFIAASEVGRRILKNRNEEKVELRISRLIERHCVVTNCQWPWLSIRGTEQHRHLDVESWISWSYRMDTYFMKSYLYG